MRPSEAVRGARRIARVLPPLRWLRAYRRDLLRGDLTAGLTVAVMLVPQAMAYAALAGLPPVAGLYASVVPVLVYALLGTSGQLAVGPVAITALLTASAVTPLAAGDPVRYGILAATLALLVGLLQAALGLVRAGALVSFLSHPVVAGFTAGAAVLIGASQLGTVLGVNAERAETLPGTLAAVGAAVGGTNIPTLAVALTAIALLVLTGRLIPRVPGALVAVAAATVATAALGLDAAGVAIVGDVPAGLPGPSLPSVDVNVLAALLPSAAAIAIISYAEGISVAKAIAARTRARINPDQELLATGGANVAAGLFSAFPVAGGFSRSAVNASAGARTPLAGVVTAGIVAVAVLFFTPLFYYLPTAVLAAVILVALTRLIHVAEMRTIVRTSTPDGIALVGTFLATIVLGVEPGLALGVGASLAMFLWRTSRPHIAELGRVEGTTLLRNTRRWPVRTDPQIAVLRVDAPLYFANAARVADLIRTLPAERPELRAIVLDASVVPDIDASAVHELARAESELSAAGVELHLTTVRGPVRDVLERAADATALRNPQRIHDSVPSALSLLAPDGTPLLQPAAGERRPERVL